MPFLGTDGRLLHVVPALLPESCDRQPGGEVALEVMLAFYTGDVLCRLGSHIDSAALKQRCSLPAGIFEQVGRGAG